MKSVREIAEEIVAREGGFVDDPDDPGGATKYGVTLGTLKGLGMDLTRDGQVNTADVHALSRAEAVNIFIRHYFDRVGIAMLPPEVQPSVFDMYVNSGANAVKVLQRMLARMGFECSADGVIGPQTVQAASAAQAQTDTAQTGIALADTALAGCYGMARRDYYYALADARPASRKYARRRDGGKGGWILRAEAFIPPDLWLSDAQHQARVSAWN